MKPIPLTAPTREFVAGEEEKCIGCKACMKGCPMLDVYCENPKELLGELRDRGRFSGEMPYTCMLCGYCARVCPKDVSFRDVFFAFRQEAVRAYGGKLPGTLHTDGVRMHQKLSASPLITTAIPQGETLFFPGCALLAQSPAVVESAYAYLREKIPGLGITNRCCFKPTEYLGDAEQFDRYAQTLYDDLQNAGVRTILTACSNCMMSFRRHLEGVEIVSVYEVLAQVGIPAEKQQAYADRAPLLLHDPCPTRNEAPVQEAIRTLAAQLGLTLGELKYNRGRTLCCGTGGMVKLTAPQIHEKHKTRRAEEGEQGMYLTYCRECATTLTQAGRPTLHLLDFLFSDGTAPEPMGLAATWLNRIRAKKMGTTRRG